MLLETLASMNTTMTELDSLGLWYELCGEGWRCYSSEHNAETEALAKRFASLHARIPGVFGTPMAATRPVEIFGWSGADTENSLHGALFLNGAVAWFRQPQGELLLLFVDDDTAISWGYSDEYIRMIPTPCPPTEEAESA